jgi:hypothetical protein
LVGAAGKRGVFLGAQKKQKPGRIARPGHVEIYKA